MSTALAVHAPSGHNSPLRVRENDQTITSSPLPQAPTSKSSQNETRRSVSSGSSARVARNNLSSRSPSGEGRSPRRGHGGPRSHGSHGSRSPANLQPGYAAHNGNTSHPTSSPNVPIIKKELPSSPESQPASARTGPTGQSRHRPRKLDLTRNKNIPQGASTVGGRPSTALTSKDSGNLSALHGVGIACLSPGFQTHDPNMREGIARSMEMREQQRQIIEARLHGKPGPDKSAAGDGGPQTGGLSRGPGSSKRKGPPPGLSINAPSPHQFASEPRVIQSAPLNQSFTGLHKGGASLSRQVLDRNPSNAQQSNNNNARDGPPLAVASHSQTSNRLPPISDVFASENLPSARRASEINRDRDRAGEPPNSGFHAPHSTYSPANPPLTSPGYPPPPASAGLHPPQRSHGGGQENVQSHSSSSSSQPSAPPGGGSLSHRQREFKSAEDAVATLSGGREDLLPKIVHYGGSGSGSGSGNSASGSGSGSATIKPSSPHTQHVYAQAQNTQAQPGSSTYPRSAALHPDFASASGPRSGSGRRRTREEYEQDSSSGYPDNIGERMDIDPRDPRDAREARGREREREHEGSREQAYASRNSNFTSMNGPRTGGDVPMSGVDRDREREREYRQGFRWEDERDRGRRQAQPPSAHHLSARSAGLTSNGGEGQQSHAQQQQARAIAQAQAQMMGQGQRGEGGQATMYAPFSGLARDFRERERDRERDMAHQSDRSVRYPDGAVSGGRGAGGVEARSGAGRLGESPETARRKREEFMGLCARAWDLLHS